MVQLGEDDDTLADTDTKVAPHLLRGHRDPGSSLTSGGVQVGVGDEEVDHDRVEKALQEVELSEEAVTGQHHGGGGGAGREMDVLDDRGPRRDVFILRGGLLVVGGVVAVVVRQLLLLGV